MLIDSFRISSSWKSWSSASRGDLGMSFSAARDVSVHIAKGKLFIFGKCWLTFDLDDLLHNPISHELSCIFQSKLLWKTSRASKFERAHLEVVKVRIHHFQEKPPPGEPLRKEIISGVSRYATKLKSRFSEVLILPPTLLLCTRFGLGCQIDEN